MKLQLLPSSFEEDGRASARQHLSCFIVDDLVAIDAGSLAMATNPTQKQKVRDVILTHAHLDHIAGLPLFIDDLFANLTEPLRVYAPAEVIEVLERDIFNWSVYPRFSELKNENGKVLEYRPFEIGEQFSVGHLRVRAVEVNHKVPSVGLIVSNGEVTFAMSGDTAETKEFWERVNQEEIISAVLIECAFPNKLNELARISYHLTPKTMQRELRKNYHQNCLTYIVNLKPMYREEIVREIEELEIENLQILEVGQVYEW
jgi:cAMP phosphodiesterase